MSLGRYDKNYRPLYYTNCYGDDGGAASVQVLFQQDAIGINPFGQCPGFARAVRATKVQVTAQTAVDTNPGNWVLRLRKNENLVSDVATFSFALTVALASTAGDWSVGAIFQPGDRWFVIANGAAKNVVIVRATIDWEIL